ncbi:hypothetical protein DFA_00414 [Cavenderia fasciculata]|uniref:Patatin family protein n=1 Tax=Cavenderia fasciculata TaxID=261658 RepID=F4PRQ4_CACFS|nr:uncharacterized protein DFA_00414 [Cavenderia fasciculata]EGG20553.1 hypothetical protein DFA_00414 [Cavenderia fasciculata]|eukprot:XP_004358403.1 hypothetical protein DFA_00414 [Cavenderia fasciculata]
MSMYLLKGGRSLISSTLSSQQSFSFIKSGATALTTTTYNNKTTLSGSSSLYSYRSYAKESSGDGEEEKKKKKKDTSKNPKEAAAEKKDDSKDASGKKIDKKKLLKVKNNRVSLKDSTQTLVDRVHQAYNVLSQQQLTDSTSVKVIKRDQLLDMISNGAIKEYSLIDLRDPKEFFGDYPIKESLNMPMDIVVKKVELDEEALEKKRIKDLNKRGKKKESKLDKKKESIEDEFNFWEKSMKLTSAQWKDKFGFPKVAQDSKIIFYSANNGRSLDCANMAVEGGFTKNFDKIKKNISNEINSIPPTAKNMNTFTSKMVQPYIPVPIPWAQSHDNDFDTDGDYSLNPTLFPAPRPAPVDTSTSAHPLHRMPARPQPVKHVFLLSIDGGGIRGLMPAIWLKVLEDELRAQGVTKPLNQVFDLSAGTSIGGILALSVSKGLSPDLCIDLFQKNGNKIFGRSIWDKFTNFGVFRPKYSVDGLIQLLNDNFGENTTMDELKGKVVVTSCTVTGKPKYFTNIDLDSNNASLKHDHKQKVVKVARCTSAAPLFFPAQEMEILKPIIGENEELKYDPNQKQTMGFVDGCCWINNSSGLVAKLAFSHFHNFQFQPEKIHILSLGTGDTSSHISNYAGASDIVGVFDILMSSNSRGIDYSLKDLYGKSYVRINPMLNEPISMDDASDETLDALNLVAGRVKSKKGVWKFDKTSLAGSRIYKRIQEFVKVYVEAKKSEGESLGPNAA